VVAAIFEPDAGMRARAAALAPGARWFGQHRRAAGPVPGLDCLLIASPNHLHLATGGDRRDAPLPVLVEKPLFTDPADAPRWPRWRYPAPIWVAMEYRYMPPVAP
jgi:predicted dehydrogenase